MGWMDASASSPGLCFSPSARNCLHRADWLLTVASCPHEQLSGPVPFPPYQCSRTPQSILSVSHRFSQHTSSPQWAGLLSCRILRATVRSYLSRVSHLSCHPAPDPSSPSCGPHITRRLPAPPPFPPSPGWFPVSTGRGVERAGLLPTGGPHLSPPSSHRCRPACGPSWRCPCWWWRCSAGGAASTDRAAGQCGGGAGPSPSTTTLAVARFWFCRLLTVFR